MSIQNSVAIVGAGLSGLTLAQLLSEKVKNLTIIEKSKSVGGRMATRRESSSIFDHGAQFFSDSPEENFFWHERWQKNGASKLWFSNPQKRYSCGIQGMTSLAKDLALGQNIIFNEKIMTIEVFDSAVNLYCESGKKIETQSLVLTAPLPQNLEILRASKIDYPSNLENIYYAKALVGLFQIENEKLELNLNYPQDAIFSIASNRSKGLSQKEAITVVMNPEFSEYHFDQPDELNLELIEQKLKNILNLNIQINFKQLKKWRYSHPLSIYSEKFLPLSNQKIILAGDAFGGPSLNGAIRSACAVAKNFDQNGLFHL